MYGQAEHIWASTLENMSSGVANKTGADQPAHPLSLISAVVIRFWKLATGEISMRNNLFILTMMNYCTTRMCALLSMRESVCLSRPWS